jgi:hypothetical protein
MKITWAGECLANDSRSGNFAVRFEQLAIRSIAKENLRNSCDRERIYHSEQNGGNQSKPDCSEKVFLHDFLSNDSEMRQQ